MSPIMSKISFAMNAQSRLRPLRPWFAALAALFFIWSLRFRGTELNPFSAEVEQFFDHLGAAPTEIFGSSSATFPPFDSLLENADNAEFVSERPLILFAYFETELARQNLIFFVKHALHSEADFLFVFNGETDADQLIPVAGNIRFLRRKNDCYDLGAFAEILTAKKLYKSYTKYIMMNASIRGPFIPYWSTECWSDMYLSKLTNSTKLVGMTLNCSPRNHIQSMLWVTDRVGLETLLSPSRALIKDFVKLVEDHPSELGPVPMIKHPGINSCPHDYWDAVSVEVYATSLLQAAGFKVDAMMYAFHSSPTYEEECGANGDTLGPGRYYGTDLHPYDTVFAKTNRAINELVLERLTGWTDSYGYSSYDFCRP